MLVCKFHFNLNLCATHYRGHLNAIPKRTQWDFLKNRVKPAVAAVSLPHLHFWLAGTTASLSNWLVSPLWILYGKYGAFWKDVWVRPSYSLLYICLNWIQPHSCRSFRLHHLWFHWSVFAHMTYFALGSLLCDSSDISSTLSLLKGSFFLKDRQRRTRCRF